MRLALCALVVFGCSQPARTSPRDQPAAKLVFRPIVAMLPPTAPITTCAPPACAVIRQRADAPPPLREIAEKVDFERFVLVSYMGESRDEHTDVVAYDGTPDAAGVLALPPPECPYCGGRTPPRDLPIHIVVRVPRVDGDIKVRETPPACSECPKYLP